MNYNGKKVIVTGGCGFIGSHLVEALISAGAKVVIIDSMFSGKYKNSEADLKQIDILNKDSLSEIIDEDVDVIFHLAAHFGHPRSMQDTVLNLKTNIEGTVNLLEICREKHKPRIVLASTMTVYGGEDNPIPLKEEYPTYPKSPYDITKATAENYFKSYYKLFEVPSVILRFSNAYGPRDLSSKYRSAVSNFIHSILRGIPPVLHFEGKATRDFISIKDIVQGIMLAGSHKKAPGEIFNICTGIETTVKELVDLIIKYSGKSIIPEIISSVEYYSSRSVGAPEKAKKILGYNPAVKLENGIKETVQWCMDNWDFFSVQQPYSFTEKSSSC